MISGEAIRISGTVQGVGFRPTVWKIASRLGLCGDIRNDGRGVLIHLWATKTQCGQFLAELQQQLPPLAHISTIKREEISSEQEKISFEIIQSESGIISTNIAPDAASCDACIEDVLSVQNRRYRYPFTNCTHCGPRLSIIHKIPYDRANTSMAKFPLCPSCEHEYTNPADRRFHAQPNACEVCGPHLWLEDRERTLKYPKGMDAIQYCAQLLKQGAIVAIKGIGGFHLACDASREAVVATLRQRKQRYQKPFALMAADLDMVQCYAKVSESERQLLTSPAAPIVLLEKSQDILAASIAPNQQRLGFVLPYTPLHHLLMKEVDMPIVLTSANLSDDPQVTDNDVAHQQLNEIADYFLMHDRDIVNRVDDSVQTMMAGAVRFFRRARGYAPAPVRLHESFKLPQRVMAMGAELKNTFCLLQHGEAVLSQHIGDLESTQSHHDYRKQLQLYQQIYQFSPDVIVVDHHPDYLSTAVGYELANESGARVISVQHHHAHIAAVMAEYQYPVQCEPILGIALDGLGLGDDGTIWGGEFLLCDYQNSKRVGHFAKVAMPGATQSIKEPWRNTFAHLCSLSSWDDLMQHYGELEAIQHLNRKPVSLLTQMIDSGLNTPMTSSAGRLFDAVAALLGFSRERVSYEGQAAIEMESCAAGYQQQTTAYPYEIILNDGVREICFKPMWKELLDDMTRAKPQELMARRFHQTMIDAISSLAKMIATEQQISTIALSGGVLQNRLLLEGVQASLLAAGLQVLIPSRVPLNDGGLALGQVVIGAAEIMSVVDE